MKDFSLKESGGEELEVAVTCIMCLGGFWQCGTWTHSNHNLRVGNLYII